MPNLFNHVSKNKLFLFLLGLILLSGIYFRFVNFSERWTLSQDQARDAIIANYAINSGKIPLIGPHSSAGDFSFGPIYYWLIIFFNLFSFGSINSGWVGFTILSCLTIILFAWLGYKMYGKTGSVIFSLVSAFCSAQILHSTDMLNPIPIAFLTTLLLLTITFLVKTNRIFFGFLAGLVIGIAVNFHFEAFLLLPLISTVSVFMPGKNKLKNFMALQLGLFIGLLPLIYFDFAHNHQLFLNFFNYTFLGQENMTASISWIKEIVSFWPKFFGEVLFNLPFIGYSVILVILIAFGLSLMKKIPITPPVKIISFTFLIQIFLLHFYNGVRSPVYMIVFHAFIIFLTAFSLWVFYSLNKYIGIFLITLFLILSIFQNVKIINQKNQLAELSKYQNEIKTKSPGRVKLYERPESSLISLPLFFLYNYQQNLDDSGYKIGLCENKDIKNEMGQTIGDNCPKDPTPFGGNGQYQMFDLNGIPEAKLHELGFTPITEAGIFNKLYQDYQPVN